MAVAFILALGLVAGGAMAAGYGLRGLLDSHAQVLMSACKMVRR